MNKTNKAKLLQSTVEKETRSRLGLAVNKKIVMSRAPTWCQKGKNVRQGVKSWSPGNVFPNQKNYWHTPGDLVSSYHYESYGNQWFRRMSSTNQEKLPDTVSPRIS